MALYFLEDNSKPSFREKFSSAMQGVNRLAGAYGQLQQEKKQTNKLNQLTGMDLEGLSPDLQKLAFAANLENASKLEQLKQKEDQKKNILQSIFGGEPEEPSQRFAEEVNQPTKTQVQEPNKPAPFDFEQEDLSYNKIQKPKLIPDKALAELAMTDPALARELREQNNQKLAEYNDKIKQRQEQIKENRRQFEVDRKYQTGFAKDVIKESEGIRTSLPKKLMSLKLSRDAVESNKVSTFSPNFLAELTGFDVFRNAKGAQLVTAAKENLLSNMSRVTGRAQNMWFEQRLNSMFPKIGQSKEANLTVQEMLEGEAEMDQTYLKEFDRLAEEDKAEKGFVQYEDLQKRAQNAVKYKYQEIANRTSYRIREIEEQEMGKDKLKELVGKDVIKGTPLTLTMAKLYRDKFGDKAADVARKNGYTIPTKEQFLTYEKRPEQYMSENE